jgi:hypothetical protein
LFDKLSNCHLFKECPAAWSEQVSKRLEAFTAVKTHVELFWTRHHNREDLDLIILLVVLYECKMWSLALKKGHKLQVPENRELRELCRLTPGLYKSPNTVFFFDWLLQSLSDLGLP